MAEPVRPIREEPTRPVREEPMVEVGRRETYTPTPNPEPYEITEPQDLVRWGPIFAGFVASVATSLLLLLIGAGLGLSGQAAAPGTTGLGTGAAIWSGISLLIALFVGGWVAARSAAPSGQFVALLNGAIVWSFWLFFLLLLTAIGAAALVPTLAGTPGVTGAPAPAPGQAAGGVWTAVLFLLVGLAAAMLGGSVGKHQPGENMQYFR